jgi:uncharacterized protein
MILNTLAEYAKAQADSSIVTDVRVGLSYTAVQLDNGSVGTAMTFRNEIHGGCLSRKTPLAGQRAVDLIAYNDSSTILERTIALATINAVINYQKPKLETGDILNFLDLNKTDKVGMVGYFTPLVPTLQAKVDELFIFEKNHQKTDFLYADSEAYELLPLCSVAIITSTSLTNLSLESLLKATVKCRRVALVGASTPLAPEVFSPFGISFLSGVIITEPTKFLRIVSEGGGMKTFKGNIQKVNIIL